MSTGKISSEQGIGSYVEGIGHDLISGSTEIGLESLNKPTIKLSENSLSENVSIIQRLSLPSSPSLWP